jgi:hypothetical protein
MSIIRNIGNLHDDSTGALTGYINPVTGKEMALDATALQALVSGDGIGVAEYFAPWGAELSKAMRLNAISALPTIPETLPAVVAGTVYYLDPLNPSASDGGAGTDPAAPWATLGKLSSLNPGVGGQILIAADAVLEYAQAWATYKAYNTAGLVVTDNMRGSSSQPITIRPYYPRPVAPNTKPIIRWYATTATGDWTQEAGYSGKVWSAAWSRTTALPRELQVFFGPNRAVLGAQPGQDTNTPATLTMANQYNADGSKIYVYVPDGSNPVSYYGAMTISGGNAVFQTFWNGGHWLRIYGLRFEDCYPVKTNYASSSDTDHKGHEIAYCEFHRTIAMFFRNQQTHATLREMDLSIHDNTFTDLPAGGVRISPVSGTAGNTVSWEVYRNRVISANLGQSYGGGLLYNQAIGGTKHHAWGNYGYDCRNGAGEFGGRGAGAAQIDGCFIYNDISVNLAMVYGNIAERCGVAFQANRAIAVHYVANLAIDCGSFGSFTASAGSESNKAVTLAHNTWLWTGRIELDSLQRGPNIGGDAVGSYQSWPVFEISNQQAGANSQADAKAFQRLVVVNNAGINASGAQFTSKRLLVYPETRIASGALLVAGNASAGLSTDAIVDKDSGGDRTSSARFLALHADSSAGREWVADYAQGMARPAVGSPLVAAGEPLNVTYRDIGGRAVALAPAQPTIGCYEVNP